MSLFRSGIVVGAGTTVALLVTVFSCRPGLCPEAANVDRAYQGECVGSVLYHEDRSRAEISPKPKCPWWQLVDLSIFDGFRPGMTIEEARQRFGEPTSEATHGSARIWIYSRAKGRVQVGYEDQGSAVIPMYRWWVLRAKPYEQSPEATFTSEVIRHLPPTRQRYEAVVLNQCRLPMLEVMIQDNRVRLITWIENPGSIPVNEHHVAAATTPVSLVEQRDGPTTRGNAKHMVSTSVAFLTRSERQDR